ncbi:ABC transporter permease [Actinorugispora endophytica]|uniref:ABC-2 type transport system permease protein n=1 Tax=Actinorugispora endophytica TaxID=1605990 RepID=A0A4R6V8J8_9ACTN|nr:ABC transporter permease [Actinorugispora endophytica]TDQ55078.1 ABC-2 type transport system permease protein [Actinorugispora endophytica]
MAAPTTSAPAPRTRPARAAVSTVRQALRLTRTEFTLFHRYRMALYVAVLPAVFLLPLFSTEPAEVLPGVDAAALALTQFFAMAAMTVGVVHVSNVYAARREQLVLKRMRVSGVTPAALFGATTLSVLGVVVLQSAAVVAFMGAGLDALPVDPVLLVLSIVLVTVVMSLLGAALTRFARNAESAQMMAMVPFLVLLAASGFFIPLEVLPEPVALVLGFLPMVPAIELAKSAYFGYDLFSGTADAVPATGPDLWIAAAPSLLVLAVWVALVAYLLRFFQWDPRGAR